MRDVLGTSLPSLPFTRSDSGTNAERVRVILAEDEPVTRLAVERMLTKQQHVVHAVRNGLEAWTRLQQDYVPTLLVLDWMMPELDGIEICRRVKVSGRAPYTYIIMLTGKTDTSDVVTALDAGADDYLCKPCKPEELRARLRAGERILKLQSDLRTQAIHDHASGLPNRCAILEMVKRDTAYAVRTGTSTSVLLADTGVLSLVRNTHGCAIADTVLIEVARRLQAHLRDGDAMGRYSYDRLLLTLRDCDAHAVEVICEAAQAVTAEAIETPVGAMWVPLKLGTASTQPPTQMTAAQLIATADAELDKRIRVSMSHTSGA